MESAHRRLEEQFQDIQSAVKAKGPALYKEALALAQIAPENELAIKILEFLVDTITPTIDEFYAQFRVERSIRTMVEELFGWSNTILFPQSGTSILTRQEVLRRIFTFCGWYQNREITVQQWTLRADEIRENSVEILSTSIIVDVERSGTQGVLICPRIAFHSPDTVFLKIFLSSRGKPVLPSLGWEKWRDTVSGVMSLENKERWALVAPIQGDEQRALMPRFIDTFEVFIPYCSVRFDTEISSYNPEVSYSIGLYSRGGEKITGILRREHFRKAVSSDACVIVPPQESSLSPYCSVTGTALKVLNLRQKKPGDICGDFFISVGDFSDISHLEIRVLNEHGDLVLGSDSYRDRGGAFYLEQGLNQIVNSGGHGSFAVPFEALDLAVGYHQLQAEVCLIGLHGRVICGVLEPFELFITE